MSQEEKELLLQDLCSRLPYNVIVVVDYGMRTTEMGLGSLHDFIYDNADVKPYLRPLSSMTVEEKQELVKEFWGSHTILDSIEEIDWYLQKHFDIRNLIEKGLALEAPEGMYDVK